MIRRTIRPLSRTIGIGEHAAHAITDLAAVLLDRQPVPLAEILDELLSLAAASLSPIGPQVSEKMRECSAHAAFILRRTMPQHDAAHECAMDQLLMEPDPSMDFGMLERPMKLTDFDGAATMIAHSCQVQLAIPFVFQHAIIHAFDFDRPHVPLGAFGRVDPIRRYAPRAATIGVDRPSTILGHQCVELRLILRIDVENALDGDGPLIMVEHIPAVVAGTQQDFVFPSRIDLQIDVAEEASDAEVDMRAASVVLLALQLPERFAHALDDFQPILPMQNGTDQFQPSHVVPSMGSHAGVFLQLPNSVIAVSVLMIRIVCRFDPQHGFLSQTLGKAHAIEQICVSQTTAVLMDTHVNIVVIREDPSEAALLFFNFDNAITRVLEFTRTQEFDFNAEGDVFAEVRRVWMQVDPDRILADRAARGHQLAGLDLDFVAHDSCCLSAVIGLGLSFDLDLYCTQCVTDCQPFFKESGALSTC